MEKLCPACGRPFPPNLKVTGGVCQRMVNIISNRPDGITRPELMEKLYAGTRDGAVSSSVVPVMVHHVNKQLRLQGWQIKRSWPGPGCYYTLEKVP